MATTIAFTNQKGGVGKTSLTIHLSGALAEMGKRVLLVDVDQQGNLTSVFVDDIEDLPLTIADILDEDDAAPDVTEIILKTNYENIDIIPSNKKMRNIETKLASIDDSEYILLEELQAIRQMYDFIVIDCPTGLNKPTRLALIATNYAIVPIECLAESVKGAGQVNSYIKQIQKRSNPNLNLLGFVMNKYNSLRSIEQSYNEMIRNSYPDKVFETEFRYAVKYAEVAAVRQPLVFYQPNSLEAECVRNFTREVLARV